MRVMCYCFFTNFYSSFGIGLFAPTLVENSQLDGTATHYYSFIIQLTLFTFQVQVRHGFCTMEKYTISYHIIPLPPLHDNNNNIIIVIFDCCVTCGHGPVAPKSKFIFQDMYANYTPQFIWFYLRARKLCFYPIYKSTKL